MKNKQFSHDEKEQYYNRISYVGNRLGSNIPLEKVSYSRNWLLGADYAEGLTKNGSQLGKAQKDKKINELRNKTKLSPSERAFLNGCNSFLSMFNKK